MLPQVPTMGGQPADGMQQQPAGAQEGSLLFGAPAEEEQQQLQQPQEQHGAPWPVAATGGAIDMEA